MKNSLLKQLGFLSKELDNRKTSTARLEEIKGLLIDIATTMDSEFNQGHSILSSMVRNTFSVDSRYDRRKLKSTLSRLVNYLG